MCPNVIVVDDDKNIINVFSALLESEGITVLATGYNGKKAIELYKKFKPDFVFIDLLMPEYDGFYGIEGIQKFDPNAKIVVVTADITSESSQKLKDHNITRIIYKPFDMKDILAELS